MNQADFAKLHGVSRKTVTTWKARGWLVMEGDEVNVEASNANIETHRKTVTPPEKKEIVRNRGNTPAADRGNSGPAGDGDGDDDEHIADVAERLVKEYGANLTFDEARTVKANFHAKLVQLDYEQKAGRLLPFEDMLRAIGDEYGRIRTRLIAIAPEHGPRLRLLALTSDDTAFTAALQEIIHEAMEELSADGIKPPDSG